MKKSFVFGIAALIAAGAVADPAVENVSIEQDALTHKVTVSYNLTGEDGIVTVCFLTNDAPFEASKHVVGDVSKVVAVGNGKKIYWQPNLDLGETNLAKYSIAARVTAWSKSSPPTYYVLNLETKSKRFYESEDALPLGIDSDVYRTKQMVFRRIYAADNTFKMGSPVAEQQDSGIISSDNHGCETLHNVTFSKDFYIGVFEVTQAQWLKIHGEIPNAPKWTQDEWQMQQSFTGDMLPIHNCTRNRWICGEKHASDSYLGAVDDPSHTTFMSKLRAFAGSGSMYNLPYEAWWE
ncbi:MAG: hypothetical protein KBT68_08155, partial [bacterium]|nr:hypothetical protein [Candidatus Colisoma equi]